MFWSAWRDYLDFSGDKKLKLSMWIAVDLVTNLNKPKLWGKYLKKWLWYYTIIIAAQLKDRIENKTKFRKIWKNMWAIP